MDNNTAAEWKKDYKEFDEITRQFYNKEIDVKTYKGLSGGFGSYAQRGGEASMLRLRMAGGRINMDKLRYIAESIEKYNIDKVHLTTCQTIQFHNLNADAVCELAAAALDCGIITRGGGGDFPRNVMVSPLSGVERDEYFDVLPYAEAAADYLLGFIKTVKLPRKLKVGFSNSPENLTHATFRDLGFAAREDGKFDVYSAGGLGANPKLGLKVAEGIEAGKILYYIKAMVNVFTTYGNYESRAKARTRYMQDVLGAEGYVKAFNDKLAEVMSDSGNLDINPDVQRITKTGDDTKLNMERVIAQKQAGLYAAVYHPVGGTPAPHKFIELYELIKNMKDVEIRLAPDETMYIINCTADEVKKVLDITADGAADIFETSVACIGASICQVGVQDSQRLMNTLVEASRTWNYENGVLPKIHISGCPSSCGTHQIGAIGFRGGMKVIDGERKNAFVLFINGCEKQGKEHLGKEVGTMLEKDIPEFIKETGKAVSEAGMKFDEWFSKNPGELEKTAKAYLV